MKRAKSTAIMLVALILSFLIFPMGGSAADQMANPKEAIKISNEALANYIQYGLTEKNAAAFGFKNLDDAKAARIGKPYPVRMIDLSAVKDYQPGSGAKKMLRDPGIMWFPVMVGDTFRTKIETVRIDGQWKPGEFGDTLQAQEVWAVGTKTKAIAEAKGMRDGYTSFIVHAPSLLATFFYLQSDDRELLIPAMVNPERYGMDNGNAYSADEALRILKRFAKEIKPGTIR